MLNNRFHVTATLLVLSAPAALAQSTSIVSVGSVGSVANGPTDLSPNAASISPDGRFVVFDSSANNLVSGDTLGFVDVFVRDLVSGSIERVSVGGAGGEPNGSSRHGSISDDGRFVVFVSDAQNLAPGDANGGSDIFLRDRQLGITTILSVSTGGAIGNAASFEPVISGDGAFVAFSSAATNLVPNDPNGHVDVFVRNLLTGQTRMVSAVSGGANGPSAWPTISADGRFVAFRSQASNLIPGVVPAGQAVFLRDMTGPSFELISVSTPGVPANGPSVAPSISADGSRVVFLSTADNLGAPPPIPEISVYLRDRSSGTTTALNVVGGVTSTEDAGWAQISANGEYVSFISAAQDLTPGHSGLVADLFTVQLATGSIQRASQPAGPDPSEPSFPILRNGGITDDGRFGLFTTVANNLGTISTGGLVQVFLRDQLRDWYLDLDGDGYGDQGSVLAASFQPVGYMVIGGDCDDTNPNVNPGATEVCNGIDDNCDGRVDEIAWDVYCTASFSQLGCSPRISATGFPSASATDGFVLSLTGLDGQRPTTMVHGLTSTAVSWGLGSTSVRCVDFPWTRVTTLASSGARGACDGEYAIDWLAFMAANPTAQGQPLAPGATFYVQGWYRDPGAPRGTNLTDAIVFTLCP